MTLIEAIKTGKKFRRPGKEPMGPYDINHAGEITIVDMPYLDVVAEDWEIACAKPREIWVPQAGEKTYPTKFFHDGYRLYATEKQDDGTIEWECVFEWKHAPHVASDRISSFLMEMLEIPEINRNEAEKLK